MRAGLIFVLVSVTAGGAFRGWQREHRERFDEIVASLVEADARDASSRTPLRATASDSVGSTAVSRIPAAGSNRPARRAAAAPLRPASIDVDRASEAELLRLPGIGPALAGRIVAERASGGAFGGPDGLLRVHGIGPKTLEKIRPYLTP
ncbi:MAG TPA: helix-hairpin-helix domain-containing protein [Candidatus Eisenbacteria bacterium]|nr:helix-hairpin-helix domain-containing protein [Candidatus Eisenbacteria bacterium]